LTDDDLAALCRQGFIAAERRGERTYFKLRFRRDRRLVVRYIGADPALAEAVQQELDQLQRERQEGIKLARLTEETKRMLRESKKSLALLLDEEGYAFHGYEIRRRRSRRTTSEPLAPCGASNLTDRSQDAKEDIDDGCYDEPNRADYGACEGAD